MLSSVLSPCFSAGSSVFLVSGMGSGELIGSFSSVVSGLVLSLFFNNSDKSGAFISSDEKIVSGMLIQLFSI